MDLGGQRDAAYVSTLPPDCKLLEDSTFNQSSEARLFAETHNVWHSVAWKSEVYFLFMHMYLMDVCSPWSPRHPETPEVPRLAGKPQFCSVNLRKPGRASWQPCNLSPGSDTSHSRYKLTGQEWSGLPHPPTKRLMCRFHHACRMQQAGNIGSTVLASYSLPPWLPVQYLGNVCPQMKRLSEWDCGPVGGREEIGENNPLGYLPTKVTFRLKKYDSKTITRECIK